MNLDKHTARWMELVAGNSTNQQPIPQPSDIWQFFLDILAPETDALSSRTVIYNYLDEIQAKLAGFAITQPKVLKLGFELRAKECLYNAEASEVLLLVITVYYNDETHGFTIGGILNKQEQVIKIVTDVVDLGTLSSSNATH